MPSCRRHGPAALRGRGQSYWKESVDPVVGPAVLTGRRMSEPHVHIQSTERPIPQGERVENRVPLERSYEAEPLGIIQIPEHLREGFPLYTKEDVQRWQDGATRYQQYLNRASPADVNEFASSHKVKAEDAAEQQTNELSSIQLMYQGERAAVIVYDAPLIDGATLQEDGFESVAFGDGMIVYDKDQVERIRKRYPEQFSALDELGTHELVAEVMNNHEAHETALGVMLGFPPVASLEFARSEAANAVIRELGQLAEKDDGSRELFTRLWDRSAAPDEETMLQLVDQLLLHKEELGLVDEDISTLLQDWTLRHSRHGVRVGSQVWVEHTEHSSNRRHRERLEAAVGAANG